MLREDCTSRLSLIALASFATLLLTSHPAGYSFATTDELLLQKPKPQQRTIFSSILQRNATVTVYNPCHSCPVLFCEFDQFFHLTVALSKMIVHTPLTLVGFDADNKRGPLSRERSHNLLEAPRVWKQPIEARWGPTAAAGGFQLFLQHLRDEVIPMVEREHGLGDYRILLGHSLGAVFALSTLFTDPSIFRAYICLAPSLWYDEASSVGLLRNFLKDFVDAPVGLVIPDTRKALQLKEQPSIAFFHSIGGEGGLMLSSSYAVAAAFESALRSATDHGRGEQKAAWVEPASRMSDGARPRGRLEYTFRQYPKESHMSQVTNGALADGLTWVFQQHHAVFDIYGRGHAPQLTMM
jgi:pimeloyl-ACP methyl ester carboxylesterase